MTPGDRVSYRSLAGDVHVAVVTAARTDGTVDLAVLCPGTATLVPVTGVAVVAGALARGTCCHTRTD